MKLNRYLFFLSLFGCFCLFGQQSVFPVTLSNPMDYDTIIETEPNYDLSGVKVSVNITVGTANGAVEWTPPGYGYVLYKQAVNELVKAGFSEKNISPGTIDRDKNQYGPDAKFTVE